MEEEQKNQFLKLVDNSTSTEDLENAGQKLEVWQ